METSQHARCGTLFMGCATFQMLFAYMTLKRKFTNRVLEARVRAIAFAGEACVVTFALALGVYFQIVVGYRWTTNVPIDASTRVHTMASVAFDAAFSLLVALSAREMRDLNVALGGTLKHDVCDMFVRNEANDGAMTRFEI